MRGKTDPRSTRRARDNTGSKAKVQALFEALQCAEKELSRRNDNDTRALSQVEHPRHELKRKLRSQAKENANAKRLASKRMRRVGMSRDRSRLAGRRRDARKGLKLQFYSPSVFFNLKRLRAHFLLPCLLAKPSLRPIAMPAATARAVRSLLSRWSDQQAKFTEDQINFFEVGLSWRFGHKDFCLLGKPDTMGP
jgi:hypothetical protein